METHGMSMPSLLESNMAAAKIYSLSYAQVIVAGMGGIIDLNHLALWKNIEQFKEEYEIDDINECFLRVVNLSRVFIEEDNRKASEEMRRSSKR